MKWGWQGCLSPTLYDSRARTPHPSHRAVSRPAAAESSVFGSSNNSKSSFQPIFLSLSIIQAFYFRTGVDLQKNFKSTECPHILCTLLPLWWTPYISMSGVSLTEVHASLRFPWLSPRALLPSQDPTQDPAGHLVVTSPQPPLGHDGSSDVPCFWWPWQLRSTGQVVCRMPLNWDCLMCSWLD